MRHHKTNRILSRESGERRALLRNLLCNLITHGKITTTVARAKELRSVAEKLVTLGKRATLAAERLIVARLGSTSRIPARKLMKEIAPRYKDRNGGYTRVIQLGPRASDGSSRAVIEFLA